ncbi:MAG: amino acid adenylation domain-containing protein, partial [Coxiellaceae bacterium]|nr:amino acid adenylation domain-containing protein [Coxiellaceae bacterium]
MQCIEILLKNKWEVVSVVSDDDIVVMWAKNNSILVLPTDKLNEIKVDKFYLFSIINHYLIPRSFLENKKLLLALNYHDGPLPKYAGINSTTWAIINNEKQHGITLHKIEASPDTGDIAMQAIIPIEQDETAISLNLKCSQQLLSLFKDTIYKIEKGRLKFVKQNLAQRTYYGLNYIPENYGIINGIKDAAVLYRLIRGLNFGVGYNNQVATIKVFLKDNFYIIENYNAEIFQDKPINKRNRIINFLQKNKDKDVALFNKVRDVYGNEVDFTIKVRDILTSYLLNNEDLKYLSKIKALEKTYKQRILKFLNDHSEVSIKVFDQVLNKDRITKNYIKKIDILNKLPTNTILTLVYFIILRLFRNDFIISLYLSDETIPKNLRNLVENRSFIYASQNMLHKSFADLENYLIQLQNNCCVITKDFSYRYHVSTLTDIAITIGSVANTDKHNMIIKLEPRHIEITGNSSFKMQIESIADSLSAILSKSIQKDILAKDLRYINILNQEQYQKVIYDWNQTDKDCLRDKTIYLMFEKQVLKTPNNIAVVFEDKKLSYKELNEQANQLARYIRQRYKRITKQKLNPDTLIALCLDRSHKMIIAILGVLKAGGAYVPIDPSYPKERIRHILDDTQTNVVITQKHLKQKLEAIVKQRQENKQIQIIALDDKQIQTNLNKQGSSNLELISKARDLAYVIYTSGTTGMPKGVMIEHKGVINTVLSLYDVYDFNKGNKTLAFSSYIFDVSVSEFFIALFRGAELYLVDGEIKGDVLLISKYVKKHRINYIYLPPAALAVFPKINYPSLKGIVYAGEPCDRNTGKYWSKKYALYNYYGPTEVTIYAAGKQILRGDTHLIGSPISNIQCYILDNNLLPLPIGVIGELYIGGVGVARGYLNQPQLTNERFIPNPFAAEKDKNNGYIRLYRTGDLVRWLPDGNIEYIGRNDFQVKIRGFRIELGEIESALLKLPGIKQATVQVKDKETISGTTKYLVAYYVSSSKEKITSESIVNHLSKTLPDYMIPSAFMGLDSMPLTINGKLDRKALPDLEFTSQESYITPRSKLEHKLCETWQEILGVEKIGITDNFFSLGGDSIISIQMVSRARQRGILLDVKQVFNIPTIAGLLANVKKRDKCKIKQSPVTGIAQLLPIQYWFFANANNVHYFNQAIWVIPKVADIDVNKIKNSLDKIYSYHDTLRLKYRKINGVWEQYYDRKEPIAFERIDASNWSKLKLGSMCAEIQTSLNIEKGPLSRMVWFEGRGLFWVIHHLLIDGVSWRILLEDLNALYKNKTLPLKSDSYKAYGEFLIGYDKLEGIKEYYSNIQQVVLPLEKTTCVNNYRITFSQKTTKNFIYEAQKAYRTHANDLLLTALVQAIGKYTDYKLCIDLEGHGREALDSNLDLTRTIGWFTSVYPVYLKLSDPTNLDISIKEIKEQLRRVPEKGITYGIASWIKQKIIRIPTNIVFNYLGQWDTVNNKESILKIGDFVTEGCFDDNNTLLHNLDINGLIKNGELSFIWTSNYPVSVIKEIANSFKKKLELLINYCKRQKTIAYIASDFFSVKSEADLKGVPLFSTRDQFNWFAMSEIQEAYLLGRLSIYEIGNVANHIYNEYCYTYLDIEKLEQAINLLIKIQPVLRTVYSFDKLQQRFLRPEEIKEYKIVINNYSDIKLNNDKLKIIRDKLSHKVYNPEQFPLFTFEVTKFRDFFILHVSIDLILLDAQSRKMFFASIDSLYRNSESQIKGSSITFKDYQDYYQLLKYSLWYQEDKKYWLTKIRQLPFRPEFSFKIPSMQIKYPKFTTHTLYIENDIWVKFKAKVNHYNLSYASVLLNLYGRVISYFSGCKEFLITITLFNRYALHEEVDNVWGDFTSTNLFHYADSGNNFRGKLEQTHQDMWEDISHSLYTGLEAQREFAKLNKLEADKAVSPIVFTGMIGGSKVSNEKQSFLEDSEILSSRYSIAQTSQAWIDLQAIEVGDRFMSQWLYVSQLFTEEYIAQLNKLYCSLIKYLAENDWENNIDLFTFLEKDQDIIKRANSYQQAISEDTLFSRYEHFINENHYQNNLSVIDTFTKKEYCYQQLMAESELLAKYLLKISISGKKKSLAKVGKINKLSSKLIGILSEKGYNQVITTLAIMKINCGYLPLNITWPAERINDVLKQGGVKILLISKLQYNQKQLKERLAKGYRLLIIEDILSQIKDNKELINKIILPVVKPDDIAYVIFTSGSTGKPKGVTISHRGALNTIDAINNRFNVTHKDRVLALSDLSFDLSVYDIFGVLAKGGAIIFPEQERAKEPDYWLELINRYQITIWNTVPQLAELLVEEATDNKLCTIKHLRLFLLSGDWIPLGLPDVIKNLCKRTVVMSLGGATEGSIWSVWYTIDKIKGYWSSIPYGVPLPNQKMYILNHNLECCPIGVKGEIYIGGVGVALNYWNDDIKTNKSFINHNKLGRLYKTGDLGRWHENGNIEILGRDDGQVKIKGMRIELGEIESTLLKLPEIKQATVQAKSKETISGIPKYLVAYYVSNSKVEVTSESIITYLSKTLPDYMIPSAFMELDSMPLTTNGKLDRNALPDPEFTPKESYVAPRNELEHKLCEIWQKILGVEKIGITESFFNLGGTSLSIIKLQQELTKLTELKTIKVTDLFKYTTIEQLTEFIGSGYTEEITKINERKRNQCLNKESDVAIIAMSGEFSGCKNISEYWDLILLGKEGLKRSSIEECKQRGIPEEILQDPNFIPVSGHIFDIDKFDANFWRMTPNDAKNMDPQTRKFIEHCWYLLEMAGYIKYRHRRNIGVFAGSGGIGYAKKFAHHPYLVNEIESLSIKDTLATHVAYLLGLSGPAVNINTACSTSLVTVVEACRSLVSNYCNMAIAGGSAFLSPEEIGYIYQEGMVSSKDGHCRTFDYKASGTVFGSCIGAVLLKRLPDAKKDGDNIIAVIKGYATNNDGNRKVNFTAPSVLGQKECIINAQNMAGIKSDMITYIECHGTGTKLGDPIEVQALDEVLKYNAKNSNFKHKCILGAVKANIGHSGATAGVAGLIKVCQMLRYNTIPKQINYEIPNAELLLENTNFEIITETRKWDQLNNSLRTAGVSSFGIGGTNAHVILQEAPKRKKESKENRPYYLLSLSA